MTITIRTAPDASFRLHKSGSLESHRGYGRHWLTALVHWSGVEITLRLVLLTVLIIAWSGFSASAQAAKKKVTQKQPAACECVFPWREYTRPVTPDVERLFQAARNADEETFTSLIGTVSDISEYAVDARPLLAALIFPVEALSKQQEEHRSQGRQLPEQLRLLRKANAQTFPAKMRMLALALEHGASVKDTTYSWPYPPLHLATIFGSPEMVRLLLKYKADPNQTDNNESRTALEFALDKKNLWNPSGMPVLVEPAQRTEMVMDLLAAGALRPYKRLDELKLEDGKALERPAADYLFWPSLAELTVGGDVMEAVAKTGTTPVFDAEGANLSPLAHAARAGNAGGVRWLKGRAPRIVGDGDPYGRGEKQVDLWASAASWALYPPQSLDGQETNLDEILTELIDSEIVWGQDNELRDGRDMPLGESAIPQPRAGTTLMHHLVSTGHPEWIKRIVQLGAPVDGTDLKADGRSYSPLFQAVLSSDSEMVRLLLSLGADPLAGPRPEQTPLYEAIRPGSSFQSERSGDVDSRVRDIRMDILAAMLEKLSPQQKESLGENDPSPLAYAFGGYRSIDARVVRLLLAAGQSAAKLNANALVSAVRDEDPTVLIDLLDHGAVVREKDADADDVNALSSKLLVHAVSKGHTALLSRLLQEGANPNYRSDDGWTAVELAIHSGSNATLDLLLANGGRIDTSPTDLNPVASSTLDLAVYSNDEEMVLRIVSLWGGLSQACLKHDKWLMAIALYSPDSYWKLLINNGLATPSSTAGNCKELNPMTERIVNKLLDDPSTVLAGWLSQRLVARLKDLWHQASFDPSTGSELTDLLLTARSKGRDDVVQVLASASGINEPAVPSVSAPRAYPKPSKRDKTLQKSLVGHYYLMNTREVGSELLLRADGTFEYMLAYGAVDEYAQGNWMVRGSRVIFQTASNAPSEDLQPFKLVSSEALSPGENSSYVSVHAYYNGHSVPGVTVTAVGCDAPEVARGRTGDEGWSSRIVGPICHVVLHHPDVNRERAFVYSLPSDGSASDARYLDFEAQLPDPAAGIKFNVEMDVDKGALVWHRSGRAMRYERN